MVRLIRDPRSAIRAPWRLVGKNLRVPGATSITVGPSDFRGIPLVGGDPGDANLITVAGLKALLAAGVVISDRLAPRALLAWLAPSVEERRSKRPVTVSERRGRLRVPFADPRKGIRGQRRAQ